MPPPRAEFEPAFASLVHLKADALIVGTDPYFTSRRERIAALASHYAVPATYEWREFVTAGGLISYGASLTPLYREAGIYVGKALKGAKSADLPIRRPTNFELVINLKAATALGLTAPPTLLTSADTVICGDAGNCELSTGVASRRPKRAKARSRGELGTGWQRVLWGFDVGAELEGRRRCYQVQ